MEPDDRNPRGCKGNTHDGVGDTLGLTPTKQKDRNMQVTKVADAVPRSEDEDRFVAAEQRITRVRTPDDLRGLTSRGQDVIRKHTHPWTST